MRKRKEEKKKQCKKGESLKKMWVRDKASLYSQGGGEQNTHDHRYFKLNNNKPGLQVKLQRNMVEKKQFPISVDLEKGIFFLNENLQLNHEHLLCTMENCRSGYNNESYE